MKTSNPVTLIIHGHDSIKWATHLLDLMKAEQKALATWSYIPNEVNRTKYLRLKEQVNNYPERPEEIEYEKV